MKDTSFTLPGPWDDPQLHRPYDQASLAEKVFNKLQLQEMLQLPLSDTVPLIATDGQVPPGVQGVALSLAKTPMLSMLLAGCDIIVTGDVRLQAVAKRYGCYPVEDAAQLQAALQLYADDITWYPCLRQMMQTC